MRLRLGYDTYSIRAFRYNAFQHLEFAQQQKLDAIQFSDLGAFESLEPAYLARVKQRSEELGIKVDAGVGCVCELSKTWSAKSGTGVEVLTQGLQVAHGIGAKVMRCVMGNLQDRLSSTPLSQLMEVTARNLKAVKAQSQDLDVKIAIENHKDLQARQMKVLIEECGIDFVGANLDLGNPPTILEHPMTTLEVLGPYTLTSHVRDSAVYEIPGGAGVQWTALGDGNIDFKAIVSRYAELCPNASVQLEIITGRAPYELPYLDPKFWRFYEDMPARDFARFVALAKSGRPFAGNMVVEDIEGKPPAAEFKAALAFQQMHDLERSFTYAWDVLGIGGKR